MVFEEPLRAPITNWNISNDKFIFQKSNDASSIFVVRLFMDESPIVFKFKLPKGITDKRVNSYFDPESDSIIIPPEIPKNAEHTDEFGQRISSHSNIELSHQDFEEVANEDQAEDAKKMAKMGEI